MKISKLDLKWVHMVRYELKQDGAIKLMTQDHFQTPPDPQNVYEKSKNDPKITQKALVRAGLISKYYQSRLIP